MENGPIVTEQQANDAVRAADKAVNESDLKALERQWMRLVQAPSSLKTERIRERIESYASFVRQKHANVLAHATDDEPQAKPAVSTKPAPRKIDHRVVASPATNLTARMELERTTSRQALERRLLKRQEKQPQDDEAPEPMELTSDDLFGIAKVSLNRNTKPLMEACDALMAIGKIDADTTKDEDEIAKKFEQEASHAFALIVRAVMRLRLETKTATNMLNMYAIRKGLPPAVRETLLQTVLASIDSFERDEDEQVLDEEGAGPTAAQLRKEENKRKKTKPST